MAALKEYKCPCCGGGIVFDSDIQKMKCPFCDTEFEMETLAAYDADLNADGKDDLNWSETPENEWIPGETDGMRIYVCESCGGEVIGDETLAATACPYCGNPVVMKGQFYGDLKPDYVIPFQLNKEAAKQALTNHLTGKRLLPKVFKNQNHIDEVKGLYVPFWLFNAEADANIRYKATKIRTWSDRNYNYTETSYFSVIRAGMLGFENVPADGASKMPDDLTESLEPYDFSKAVDFQTAYLSGYFADRYDVDAEACIERANARIKKSTETAFAATVNGYSSVVPEGGSVRCQHGKAKYALLPVWLLNTTWNGNKYTFAMNGQTGKFVGNLPLDKGAYRRWLFGLTAGIAAAIMGVLFLIWKLF
ncbi:MAG: hypothetical protein J5925_01045 [Clostridia bacterium]|nr:hypothetical protein [Clostridia bacterium]